MNPIHPAAFVEILPGQYVRAGQVLGMQVGRDAQEGLLGVMVITGQDCQTFGHQFATMDDARLWAAQLREVLFPDFEQQSQG